MTVKSQMAACILFLIAGCERRGATVAPSLPAAIGSWRLKSMEAAPPGDAPQLARATGIRAWWRAEYAGPSVAHVQVYKLASSGAGLDLVQKWRAAANTVTFYTDDYFIV